MIKSLFIMSIVILTFVGCQKKDTPPLKEHFFVRHNGCDMPIHVSGNNTKNTFILLLHGGPGDGSLKYANHTFSELLEQNYTMVYWDQRHQGNSHGHLKKEDVTIDLMVDDVYAVVKSLKKRYGEDISLFLLGHSWGGLLGTAFMVKENYQNEVNGWIESGGAHDFKLMNKAIINMFKTLAPEEIAKGNHIEQWQEILDYCQTLDTNDIKIDAVGTLNEYAGIAEKLISLPPKTNSELSGLELNLTGSNNPYITGINKLTLPNEFFEEIVATSLTDELHKITKPTLLLWGKYDFKVPKTLGETAYNKLGTNDKFIHIYQNAGHSSMRYQPHDFVNDVKAFIELYK